MSHTVTRARSTRVFSLTARLAPRDRRVLALGAAVITAVVVLGRGVPAWVRWARDTHANAAELTAEAARADADLAAWPLIRDSLRARNTRYLALAPVLISGTTPAAASANLAALISAAAARTEVTLGALELSIDTTGMARRSPSHSASRDSMPSAFARVLVRGDAAGDVRGLVRFIAALEQGPTLLSVEQMSVSQPDPAAPPERMETLHAQFVVAGLALTPSS